ncbi:MAG: undecaprenyldiphospho-muramoylpentapeptide beta-N-acetylglucosaminyltransferase [Clostridiales Family XIII bacterium]|jgi:UDP-N-acetylglucosamine--N-acetylmuramyl-(pentapeptide) pyrophosphoryl-undecaprenol N-acetylglucosamine transferase|nr:undecaprenyldiphospho-muramoylpentapeptide beta-N-acetylglucosaminyltransferase [Clostridiales Family XIII bacterium]
MRALMAGGGTGGHIYPAIAIAEKIMRRQPDSEILFVGAEQGMEKDIVPSHGFSIRFIRVRGFSRSNMIKNIGVAADLLRAAGEARAILREFGPDVVIGTGGYVSGPVVREAGRAGIRAFIHEQNAYPGLANRMAERYAEKVFLAFEDGKRYFRSKEKAVVTGNPVRAGFAASALGEYREKLGIGPHEFVVLCFGGSRGARKINESMAAIMKRLCGDGGVRLFFITGDAYYDSCAAALEEAGMRNGESALVMRYTGRMHEYLSSADLVISRGGALAISEICACGKAAILIPSPNVTGNHQHYNAKTVADRGGAMLMDDAGLTPDSLLAAILRLKNNRPLVNAMGEASGRLGRVDAADVIYRHIAGEPSA